MFEAIFIGLFLIPGLLCWPSAKFDVGPYNSDWNVPACFAVWLTVLPAAWLVALVIATGVAWSNQVSDQEALRQTRVNAGIYEAKAERLTASFARYLADQYPAYERSIFRTITPQNPQIVFVRFPEIRASATLLALVGQIRSLQDQVYGQETATAQLQKNIATRRRNPWYLTAVLP